MIVFISNFFNHHQFPVADELYRLTGGQYRFIETERMPENMKSSGYPTYDHVPYVIKKWENPELCDELIENADVVVYGNIFDYKPIASRLKNGKLTFEVGERWLKKGWLNFLSPRLLKSQWYYHTQFYNKPLYRLCSSAFAAGDMAKMHSFKNRCFKWGYFTEVEDFDVVKAVEARDGVSTARILAIARFLPLKHHELTVQCAKRLKDKGYDIHVDIYGTGPEFSNIENLIKSLSLQDVVSLCGTLPNKQLMEEIRQHDIFLFTSDRHEGWGAVVNEAMGNACPVVGSNAVGSVPFLIQDGKNGMIFKSGDLDSLVSKVETLLNDNALLRSMSYAAYDTMRTLWSPKNAARRFFQLVETLNNDGESNFESGPCSLTK